MTPFVGRYFNMTRAGIHADGLLKEEEIYNIFNTRSSNRPAGVMVRHQRLAGIAYWINENYGLTGETPPRKHDPLAENSRPAETRSGESGRTTAFAARMERRKSSMAALKRRRASAWNTRPHPSPIRYLHPRKTYSPAFMRAARTRQKRNSAKTRRQPHAHPEPCAAWNRSGWWWAPRHARVVGLIRSDTEISTEIWPRVEGRRPPRRRPRQAGTAR